jgi:hypothetical protein
MTTKIELDELRVRAIRAGLNLSEEELKKLLPGVNRALEQVGELRAHLLDAAEPAAVFNATKSS